MKVQTMAKDRSLKGNKSLGSLAPDHKQKPGGESVPANKVRGAKLHEGNTGNLMTGMSSYRGKGGK